jgi:Fe-S-cluster containining protein
MVMKMLNKSFQEEYKNILENLDIDYNPDLLELLQEIVEMEPLKLKIMKKVKCKKCGWCCIAQNALLGPDDIRRICGYLKIGYDDFYEKYIDKDKKIPYLKSPCPFLDVNNKNNCIIYHQRPKVCKIYPFIDFMLVINPCLLGKEIFDIIINNLSINKNDDKNINLKMNSGKDKFQKLYEDRVNLLDAIAGNDQTRVVQYDSIHVTKKMLIDLIKLLKKDNKVQLH